MTSDIDAQGRYVLRHHTLVSLRFDGVQDLELNNFNNQNAVSGIAFNEIGSPAFPEPSYEIVFGSVYGVEATFRCREVMVVSRATMGRGDWRTRRLTSAHSRPALQF